MEMNKQVEEFAKTVKSDPALKDGFNLIGTLEFVQSLIVFAGYSQGGLITRAYIERYNDPPVYNYISWVGPHQGIYGDPLINNWCPNDGPSRFRKFYSA